MTTIYHYSPLTGELAGQSLADENPLDPENPLIPAHATEIVPPAAKKGSVAVFDGSAWKMVVDQRQKTIYNKSDYTQSKTVDDLGPVPTGWTLKKPKDYCVWDKTKGVWSYSQDLEKPVKASDVRAQRDEIVDRVSREINRQIDDGADPAKWRVYRKALRNLPEQDGFPFKVTWPTAPGDYTGK